MPTYTISKGDTLSAIAAKHGTTVGELMKVNSGNPAVKSANLIIAGGNLNLPDAIAAPASGPAPSAQLPSGGISPSTNQNAGATAVGDLGNLRIALRSALNEAGRTRVENNFRQVAPLSGGVPGTIGAVVDMIRAGIKSPVESTFSDIIQTFKDDVDAKSKEASRINELRLEYGTAIPNGVTSLDEAMKYVLPLVDKERKLRLDKMVQDQASDNDVETWAESLARGEIKIGNVPAAIRTAVKVRSEKIKETLEADGRKEYQDRIAFRIENDSDYDTERSIVLQDEDLTVAEQRDVLEFIDGLEEKAREEKRKGKKMNSGVLSPSSTGGATTAAASGIESGGGSSDLDQYLQK